MRLAFQTQNKIMKTSLLIHGKIQHGANRVNGENISFNFFSQCTLFSPCLIFLIHAAAKRLQLATQLSTGVEDYPEKPGRTAKIIVAQASCLGLQTGSLRYVQTKTTATALPSFSFALVPSLKSAPRDRGRWPRAARFDRGRSRLHDAFLLL